MPRKSLSDILKNGQQQKLADAWGNTEAAEDFKPLPVGDYIATIEAGELFNAKTKNTAGYKLAFRVVEGEHTGRRFWHDVWLTEAALAMAKRDLLKIGVTSLAQLERPLPQGIVCAVKLVLRRDDDGAEFNRVKRFDVLRVETPKADPFAPASDSVGQAFEPDCQPGKADLPGEAGDAAT
ncbi:MAG TPA: DUF669 domain-containing protein [Pirellulales bacterium]|nr:DUF669 domain-containing protein [Pirellulales bacterium]